MIPGVHFGSGEGFRRTSARLCCGGPLFELFGAERHPEVRAARCEEKKVRMRRCEEKKVRMRRCEQIADVKMRGCEDVKM